MSAPTLGLILFFGLTIIFAICGHLLSKKALPVSIGAAVIAALVFQIINYVHLGYLDPFFWVAFISSSLVGFAISMGIGILIKRFRARGDK